MRRSDRSRTTAGASATTTGSTAGAGSTGVRLVGDDPTRGRDARTTARSRKRFARRQWRRRWLAWKPLVLVVLVVGLGAAAVWLVWFSSVLAVEQVRVTGTDTLTVQEVQSLAAVDLGRPLARVDVDGAERRIGALATVRSVEVTRRFPHRLLISVEERVPVAVVTIGDRLRALDRDGVVFGGYDRAPAGLPRVEVVLGVRPEALGEAATVVATLPRSVARRVDFIEVRTVDEISLLLKDGRRVQWGSARDSEDKARVLGVLLERDASTYDVSVPGRPTTS